MSENIELKRKPHEHMAICCGLSALCISEHPNVLHFLSLTPFNVRWPSLPVYLQLKPHAGNGWDTFRMVEDGIALIE